MPATYEPIATTTLGSNADSITFSAIGNTYTDLRIVLTGKTQPTNSRYVGIQVNSDTGSNYSYTILSGDGSTASSSRGTSTSVIAVGAAGLSDTIPTFYTFDIFSYGGSTYKTILTTAQEDKNGSGAVTYTVGLWRSTSAITSVSLVGTYGTGIFNSGTTATLYGIKSAQDG